jgi:hypothetical protein
MVDVVDALKNPATALVGRHVIPKAELLFKLKKQRA